MLFFLILFDKNEYQEKEMLQKEEYNRNLFIKNLQELVSQKENFYNMISEIIQNFRQKNYKLCFLSDDQIIGFMKTSKSAKVK